MWTNGIIKGDYTKCEEQWVKKRTLDIINILSLLTEKERDWAMLHREQG